MTDTDRALLDFMAALLTSDRANAAAARARKEAITSTQYRDVMQRQEEHIAQVRSDAVADRMEYLIAEVRERFDIPDPCECVHTWAPTYEEHCETCTKCGVRRMEPYDPRDERADRQHEIRRDAELDRREA